MQPVAAAATSTAVDDDGMAQSPPSGESHGADQGAVGGRVQRGIWADFSAAAMTQVSVQNVIIF